MNTKELALKLFKLDEKVIAKCGGDHDICLHCDMCFEQFKDTIVTDLSDLSQYIDHTLLKPNASYNDIENICKEAKDHKFHSICINPYFIPFAKKKNKNLNLCTVIGFPLGASATDIKIAETKKAIEDGAREIDMVINIGLLKSITTGMNHGRDYKPMVNTLKREISAISKICRKNCSLLKVIIETCLLTPEEIKIACLIAKKASANFVKTSTGFSTGGATIENISIMRKTIGLKHGVKASGGIKTHEDALNMLKAGASRLGTSSSITIKSKSNNEFSGSGIY